MYLIFLYKQKTVYGWILTKTQFCAPIWTAAAWVSSFMHYSLKWLEKFYCFPSLHLFVFYPSLNLFIQMPHIPFPKSHKRCVVFSLISILLLQYYFYHKNAILHFFGNVISIGGRGSFQKETSINDVTRLKIDDP